MKRFVRAGLKHNRWVDTEGRLPGELPADVMKDLNTSRNMLSVFEVTDAIGAERIAAALAAKKDHPEEACYAVFDESSSSEYVVASTKSPGETPDAEVNDLHYDLTIGTVGRLMGFAKVIADSALFPILKKRVVTLLQEGFASGHLDPKKSKLYNKYFAENTGQGEVM